MEPAELTDDAFLGGRLAILQPARGFRSGLDAILAAAAVPVRPGRPSRVLDAGSGVGVIGLAIGTREASAHVTMVERDTAMAAVARRNIERNSLADRVSIVAADIAAGGRALHDPSRPEGLAPASFDHLVTNPPYFASGTGTPPSVSANAGARQMPSGSLDRWIAFLATAGKADASLTMIHRADALADVLAALAPRFGRVRILPVQPRADTPASRIVIGAVKGSRAALELRPALVLQDAEGRYLRSVDEILRCGAPLPL